jgi:hypothetical protein
MPREEALHAYIPVMTSSGAGAKSLQIEPLFAVAS